MLTLAALGLYLLLFGVAGNRAGMQLLPAENVRLEILSAPSQGIAWPDFLTLPDTRWQPWTRSSYLHAPDGAVMWVRATFANPSATPLTGVLADAELNLDRLDCWTPDKTQPDSWLQQSSGESVPANAKAIWGREPAFFITVPARGETVAYLRAQDRFAVWLRLVWWPESRTFFASQLRHTLAEALYFGVLIALFIYNAILWARLRHRDLGRYLGYLASMAVFMALVRSQTQLLGLPLVPPIFDALSSASLAFSGFFAVQFAREFLHLSALSPRLDRVARWLGWTNLALAFGSVCLLWSTTTDWVHLTVSEIVVTHGLLLVVAVVAWRRGVRHARYFLLSFGLLLIGAAPYAGRWLLAIPLGITPLFLMLGSALEMLLLSLMLADRFARLQREHLTSQLAEEKARLELLRYQLNPHFFFNALNSIYGLVYPHSKPAGELVRRLADFCRETFANTGTPGRPLREELAMLRSYLEIEQARWRDALRVEFNLDPAAETTRLPAFLLLPLVENAIKHGGATSPDVLTLRIATRTPHPDTVEIEIANTGRWLAPDEPRTAASHGIGLENLRARLARSFPPTPPLDISSRDGWVFLVLRLPRTTDDPRSAH